MRRRGGPGRCCCQYKCPIADDDFNRALLGASWDQISGVWTISNNQLSTTSSDAMILYDMDHPGGVTAHIASCDLKGDEGEKRRVVIASAADGSTYLAIEVEFGPSTGDQCGVVRLIQDGGVLHERPMVGLPPDTPVRAAICYLTEEEYNGGIVWGYVNGIETSNRSISALASAEGFRAGLATSGTSTAEGFDNFAWFSHRVLADDDYSAYEDCSTCESCPIWAWTGQTSNCEFTVTGDPYNLVGDPWEVEGHIAASDADEEGGYGVIVSNPPGDITITLGDYTAHFYPAPGTAAPAIRVDLDGPGVSESEDFDAFDLASFAFIDGVLCASIGYPVTGNRSITATPSGPVGTSATVSGEGGNSGVQILFTRCPICPSDEHCETCGSVDGASTPKYVKVTLGGFAPSVDTPIAAAECDGMCLDVNGTFILEQQPLIFGGNYKCTYHGGGNTDDLCLYNVKAVLGGTVTVDVIFAFSYFHPTLGWLEGDTTYHFEVVLDESGVLGHCELLDADVPLVSVTTGSGGVDPEACSGTPTCHIQAL